MTNPRHLPPSPVEEREMPDVSPAHGRVELKPVELPLPERDMRAKRPPLLSFLLRWSTVRRALGVVSLLALDLAAIVLAIFTALCLKALARDAWEPSVSWAQAKDYLPFAFLVASLLFARSGLYAERAQRPGLTRIVASLFETTLVALIFAVVNGEEFSSYYIFYGTLFFAVAYVSSARFAYEQLTGLMLRAAGSRGRAILVGSGEQIEAVAHALLASGGHSPVSVVGFVSLTPRPDNGLRSLGSLDDIGEIVADNRVDEVIIADPAFPQQQAVE